VAAHTFLQRITDAGRLITDAISRAVVVSGVPYYVISISSHYPVDWLSGWLSDPRHTPLSSAIHVVPPPVPAPAAAAGAGGTRAIRCRARPVRPGRGDDVSSCRRTETRLDWPRWRPAIHHSPIPPGLRIGNRIIRWWAHGDRQFCVNVTQPHGRRSIGTIDLSAGEWGRRVPLRHHPDAGTKYML